MSLILRKTSRWWYGYYRLDGKATVVPLGVQVQGIRPQTLADTGDAAPKPAKMRRPGRTWKTRAGCGARIRKAGRNGKPCTGRN